MMQRFSKKTSQKPDLRFSNAHEACAGLRRRAMRRVKKEEDDQDEDMHVQEC